MLIRGYLRNNIFDTEIWKFLHYASKSYRFSISCSTKRNIFCVNFINLIKMVFKCIVVKWTEVTSTMNYKKDFHSS